MLNESSNFSNRMNSVSISMMQQPIWIASIVLNLLLIVASIWLSITIAMYGVKSGKLRRKKKSDFNGGLVLNMAFATAGLILPRLLSTHIIIWLGFETSENGDYECEIAVDISIGAYYVALIPAYFFLWLRQKSLYEQPSIKRLYNTTVKVLSWGCIAFLLASGIGIIIIFVLPLAYQSSEMGCVLRPEEEENLLAFCLVIVVQIFGQLTLLGLFIYPLYRHSNVPVPIVKPTGDKHRGLPTHSATASWNSLPDLVDASNLYVQTIEDTVSRSSPMKYEKSCTPTRSPMRQSISALRRKISVDGINKLKGSLTSPSRRRSCGSVKTAKRVFRVIQRSIACAAVCIVSDILALVIVGFIIPKYAPKSITNTVFDISLVINVLSLIFSFENYKKILASPFNFTKKITKPTSSALGASSANEESASRNSS